MNKKDNDKNDYASAFAFASAFDSDYVLYIECVRLSVHLSALPVRPVVGTVSFLFLFCDYHALRLNSITEMGMHLKY